MKVVILAGGLGTRISEESHLKPKPMIEIGGTPILWHIMKYYSNFGFNDFIICCGYKGYVIKEYFANNNNIIVHSNVAEPWKVTVVDTGLNTQTGGRIKRIQKYIGAEAFLMTYGDGVSNIDLNQLIEKHKNSGKVVTLSAVQPGGRFGVLDIEGDGTVVGFREKAKEDGGWVNAGFMMMEPEIFGYIDDDATVLERSPLERLCSEGKLGVYRHNGFWQCMDTQRDRDLLEYLWSNNIALWKMWSD